MRLEIDLRLQAEAGADRLRDAVLVDHRQHAGHGGIDQADLGVGLAAELGRGAREQLGVGGDLGMHLHADHHLPGAGRAFDELVFFGSLASIAAATRLPSVCFCELLLLVLDEPADHLPPQRLGKAPAASPFRRARAHLVDHLLDAPGHARLRPATRLSCQARSTRRSRSPIRSTRA